MSQFPTKRLRRLRHSYSLRKLLQDVHLSKQDLILPLFIHHGNNIKKPIEALPKHFQLSIDQLPQEIAEITKLGIPAVILFGIPHSKDEIGSYSWNDEGIIQQAIHTIKEINSELIVIADCCFCEYTTHGHCGVVRNNDVANDATLENLQKQALSFAKAGADMIAPSGMIDGMVVKIREILDLHDFNNIPILSYAIKYASNLYGPFRQAADYTLQFGDRQSYQMDFSRKDECIAEASLDIQEGTDMLMVKPAGFYLDIIYKIKMRFPEIPLAAYQVSGEYAMIMAAAKQGLLDEQKIMLESLIAIKRAGADLIITYFAKTIAALLTND